ncbi:MAG: response regulator [Anaerolineae bacterium]|nr:response regulator [Anaerolineae bacterium]
MSTWMVVEDEPDIYDVLLAMFEVWGIEGIAFVDGAEAVSWIEDVDNGTVTGELPELAILDIRLPEISGPEVGARLRESSRLGQTAIVLITAYRLDEKEEQAVLARAQADALMYKPLPQMEELRRKLAEIISKRQPKAALLNLNLPAAAKATLQPVAKSLEPALVEAETPEPPSEPRHAEPPRTERARSELPRIIDPTPTEPRRPDPWSRPAEPPRPEPPRRDPKPDAKPGNTGGSSGSHHRPRKPTSNDPFRS